MRLGWILASVVLLALLAATAHGAGDDVADEFSVVNESDPVEWNNKGVALYNEGKYDEAIQAYDEAIRLDPEMAMAWYNKGNALYVLGKYDEAIQAYDEAIRLDSEFASAWNNKGVALISQGKYDEAIQACNEAIRLDNEFASAWNNKGFALISQGKYDEAIQACDEAIRLDNESAFAWNNKGNALYGLGKYDEAIQACDEAIRLDNESAFAWNNKGNDLYGLGKYDEALKCFETAIKLDPELVQAWNGKGGALYKLRKYEEARICFETALEIDPTFVSALNGKGVALYALNRTEEAIELYNKALQLDPKIPIFWYNKGKALENLNRFSEATMAFSLGRERELNSETKIGIFAVFLVIYSALAAGGYALSRRFRKYTTSIGILSINLLGFWAIMWVLSGFFDLLLVVQFLIGGVVMVSISIVLWSLSGFPVKPWMDQLDLEIEDFNRKCPRFSWLIRAVRIPAVLLFASMAVVFYFRFYLSTEILMVDFLKLSFVSIFLVGLFVTLPPIWSAMISKNLDGMTREFLLIFQFGHLGVSGLYSGLILWIFGKGSFGHSVSLGDIKFPIYSLVIVMFLFVLAIIIPYVSGSKRASRWKMALFDKERRWLDELLEVLDYPTPSLYVPKFRKVLNEIKDDNMISCQDDKFDRIKSIYGEEALRLDPHFRYRDFSIKLQEKIAEMITKFEELDDNEENIAEKARIYADAYRLRRNEIVEMIEREGQFKPKFWIALAIILTPVLGQILASMINLILKAMIDTNLGGLITLTPSLPLP